MMIADRINMQRNISLCPLESGIIFPCCCDCCSGTLVAECVWGDQADVGHAPWMVTSRYLLTITPLACRLEVVYDRRVLRERRHL